MVCTGNGTCAVYNFSHICQPSHVQSGNQTMNITFALFTLESAFYVGSVDATEVRLAQSLRLQ